MPVQRERRPAREELRLVDVMQAAVGHRQLLGEGEFSVPIFEMRREFGNLAGKLDRFLSVAALKFQSPVWPQRASQCSNSTSDKIR